MSDGISYHKIRQPFNLEYFLPFSSVPSSFSSGAATTPTAAATSRRTSLRLVRHNNNNASVILINGHDHNMLGSNQTRKERVNRTSASDPIDMQFNLRMFWLASTGRGAGR